MADDATPTGGAPSAPLTEDDAANALAALRTKPAATSAPPAAKPAETQQESPPDSAPADTAPADDTAAPAAEAPPDGTQTAPTDAITAVEAPQTAAELAQKLGLEEPKLYDIRVKTKIDGVDGEATLAQLVKSYQTEQSLTRKSMEFADQRKDFETQLAQGREAVAQRERELNSVLPVLNQLVQGEFAGIDWNQLKATDFNRYLQLQDALNSRMNGIKAIEGQLQQHRQQAVAKQQQDFNDWAKREQQALASKLPQWNDEKVAARERTAMTKAAKSYGFTDQDVSQIYDHRVVMALRDAWQYQELMAKKPAAMQKVNQAPAIARPGTPTTKSPVSDARARFNASHSEEDAAALLGTLRAKPRR